MKNHISTLLLTIAVFLQFGELNAMNQMDESASPSIRFRESGRGKMPGGVIIVEEDPADGPAHKTLIYGMKPIQVWMDPTQRFVRKAYFPHCVIPQAPFFKAHNFLIRYANLQGTGLVAYLNKEGELFGVKPPNMASWKTLRPTPTEWYIIYMTVQLKVFVRPETKTVYRITLNGGNTHDPRTHTFLPATVANIKFKVFSNGKTLVTGAELIEPYIYKIG